MIRCLKPKKPTQGFKRRIQKIPLKIEETTNSIIIDLPIQTKSEANISEHWTKKSKRHRVQRQTIALALNPLKEKIKLPCKVHLTRLAPRKLDAFENLPMSFKYIVDAICSILTGNYVHGRADSDPRISRSCDQTVSPVYGIRILITF